MGNNYTNQVSVADLCGLREFLLPINRLESLMQKRLGLSLNQAMVLCSLARGPANTPKNLSEQLGLSPPALSRILGSLEKKHLLQRRLSPTDRRSLVLELTPEGLSTTQAVEAWQQEVFPMDFSETQNQLRSK